MITTFPYDARVTRHETQIPKTALSSLIFDLEMSSLHQKDKKNVI